MTSSHPLSGKEILFTRQRHEAKRAGLHWDYRLVHGDKAYSWATKKELPEPGKSIILFEQPVHDTSYALSQRVEIPDGQYGAGVTTLDWVHKAKVEDETEADKLVVRLKDGSKFLIKKLDAGKYGDKSWLFKNLGKEMKKEAFFTDSLLQNESLNKAIDSKKPIYLYHGTPYHKEVSKEGLRLDKAWEDGRSRDTPLKSIEGFYPTLSLSSIKDYSKIYGDGSDPLLVKLDPSKLNSNYMRESILLRALGKITNTDEYTYLSDVPAKDIVRPGSKKYEQLENKLEYLKKEAEVHPDLLAKFKPDLTPEQMERLGVLIHPGSQYKDGNPKDNFFGVRASLDVWPDKWHNEEHPQGWYQWYKGWIAGKRTADDERQIKRWISFKARHLAQLQKADPTLQDLTIQPKRRQALLNWGIAPGINLEKTATNKYLVKIAQSKDDRNSWNHPLHLAGGLGVGYVAGAPAMVGGQALGLKTMLKGVFPRADIADRFTVKKMIRDNHLKNKVEFSNPRTIRTNKEVPAATNNFFRQIFMKDVGSHPNRHYVEGVRGRFKNHMTTLHELGHVKDYETRLGKTLSIVSKVRVAKTPIGIGLLSNESTQHYAAPAQLAIALPTLISEARANKNAYDAIKAHKGQISANKFLKKFVPHQMGSYVLGLSAPVIGTAVASKVIDKFRERSKKDKS